MCTASALSCARDACTAHQTRARSEYPRLRCAEEVIPLALAGKNILARAKNGTGKTGSFCIPCLEKVDTTKGDIQGVILVPTRELALQTAAVLKELGRFLEPPVEVMSLTGGTSTRDDVMRLMGKVHVLVGTPGRIIDLASRGACTLKKATFAALVRLSPRYGCSYL